MKIKIADVDPKAEKWHPKNKPDRSQIGVNYVDAYIKAMNTSLEDGRKVACKRRGLKITMMIGDNKGEALLRRIENGPEVKAILDAALKEAAEQAGAAFCEEANAIYLDC